MAKLADAADLKSAGSNPIGVQVPFRAPTKQRSYTQNGLPQTGGHFRLVPVLVHVVSGSALLAQAYAARMRIAPNDPDALLYALSLYNSGTYDLGFQNGYVAEVLKNAKP